MNDFTEWQNDLFSSNCIKYILEEKKIHDVTQFAYEVLEKICLTVKYDT